MTAPIGYNQDKQIPWTAEQAGLKVAVDPINFDNPLSIHIFWGPGQLTIVDQPYNPPDKKKWHNNEPINIPQVIRFIYATKQDIASDDYSNDDPLPPPPPPPPPVWAYTSTQWWGTQASLKPPYRGGGIPHDNPHTYTIIPTLWDSLQTDLDLGAGGGVFRDTGVEAAHYYSSIAISGMYDPHYRVQVRNSDGSGAPLYSGPIEGCPYFDLLVFRSVSWIRTRSDTGFTVFVGNFTNYNPPGTSGTQPPRCSFVDYDEVTMSEQPIADYLAILGTRGPC